MPGFVAFINKGIEVLIVFSSLALSKPLRLIIHHQKFKAQAHLLARSGLFLLAHIFHFVKATIPGTHGRLEEVKMSQILQ
jgi:hypothetical protein